MYAAVHCQVLLSDRGYVTELSCHTGWEGEVIVSWSERTARSSRGALCSLCYLSNTVSLAGLRQKTHARGDSCAVSLQKDKMEMTVSQLFIFISLSQRGTSDLTRKDPKTCNTVRPHGEINREPHHESLFSRFNSEGKKTGGIAGHSPAPALKSVSSDCQIKPAHETSLSGRINMHPGHLE